MESVHNDTYTLGGLKGTIYKKRQCLSLSPVPSAYKAASGWGVAASTQRRGVDCGDGKMPSTQDADFRAGHQNPTGSLLFSALMCPQPLEQ